VGKGLQLVCNISAVWVQGSTDRNETAVAVHFVEFIIHPLFLQNIQLGTDSIIGRVSRLQQRWEQKSALRKRLHKGGLKIVIRLCYQGICGKNQTAKDRVLGKGQVTVDTVAGYDKNIILVIGGGVTVQLQQDIACDHKYDLRFRVVFRIGMVQGILGGVQIHSDRQIRRTPASIGPDDLHKCLLILE
jgi:hypothetical protein